MVKKTKRYIKILKNVFLVFGIDALRVLLWLVLKNIYRKDTIKSVYCRNLKKNVFIRVGDTDVVLMILMFCVECDDKGRKEYDIDLGNRDIEYIIDAGANIGLFALLYAEKYPNAKIICIEPDDDNFRVLSMNIAHNKNIIAINQGLWSKKTYLQVIDRNTGSWGYMVKETEQGGGIQAVTVVDILEKYQFPRIDILKLDIEGSEYEVLLGNCKKWIERVNAIFIETHDKIILGCDQAVTDVMNKYGFIEQEKNGENRIFFKLLN